MYNEHKKTIWIIAGIIFLLLVAWFLFVLFRDTSEPSSSGSFPSSGEGGFSETPTDFPPKGDVPPAVETPEEKPTVVERIKKVFGIQTKKKIEEPTFPPTPPPSTPPPVTPPPVVPPSERLTFWQISDVPVAGATALATPSGAVPIVRYMERATGHIYDVNPETVKRERVTNTTIPRIHEALFSRNGDFVVARYLDEDDETIETFVGKIPTKRPGEEGKLVGEFLPRNIQDISVSQTKDDVFYLLRDDTGALGFMAPLADSAKRSQIFAFPFSEWLSEWSGDTKIALATKPSSGVSGYVYTVSTTGATNQEPQKVFGGAGGLATRINKDASYYLYSDSGPTLWIYNAVKRNSARTIFKTIPDKCVWAKDNITFYCAVPDSLPRGQYPDSWYQGAVSFSDTVWEININATSTGALPVQRLSDTSLPNGIDATKLFVSSNETYLFFINKKDMTLWALDMPLSLGDN